MLEGSFSELFFAGMIVSVIGCCLKLTKMCLYNVRTVDCFGLTVYNSTLFERLVGERTNSNASNNSVGFNPMLPRPLLAT